MANQTRGPGHNFLSLPPLSPHSKTLTLTLALALTLGKTVGFELGVPMADSVLRQEKVRRFEEFVDRRLKPDLVNAIAQRDKVFGQQKTFSDLKRNIENLQKFGVTSLRTMINLGSEVYAQAEVSDTQHIFVDIGMGFHVEFTWSEALDFISVKQARLTKQIEEYTHLIANIKAQIKLVCEGIRELLQLPAE
ncbi:protein UXT-like protein isoform X4 [Iris pallida]|uniref:Protein UXT-like protein isoform X4 n=1 Tax=Iris pallida TaxID=29817 RepID=A0AAX6I1U0_IRIPA|nr:protein UXT-like protein isoform X4 [Iris pallida]